MKQNYKKMLDTLLFKPLKVRLGEMEKLIVIFSHENITNTGLDLNGKRKRESQDVIKALNVSDSIETGTTVIDTYVVNMKDFMPNVEVVSGTVNLPHIITVAQQLGQEIVELGSKLVDCNSALLALRDITKGIIGSQDDEKMGLQPDDSGNLILGGTTEPLAHIVFKTVAGTKITNLSSILKKEDVIKIGMLLREIVESHIETDLEDPEKVRRLEAEIEYKIVDALPNNLKAGDIKINTKAIIEEIARIKGNGDNGEFNDEQL